MKAKVYLIALVAMLAACGVEEPYTGPEKQLVFDISVSAEGAAATKGVKAGWENGDVIYVFFEDNSTQYLKMIYEGSAWTTTDKDGGSAYPGLTLAPSGKKISAIYFPPHVNAASPGWSSPENAFVFPQAEKGYFLKAENVPYTVSSMDDIDNVQASLHMKAPEGFVQLFVEDSAPQAGTWLMTERNFTPAACGAVTPGGSVSLDTDGEGFPMPGLPATVDDETGYYFYGILNPSCRGVSRQYHFQMVTQAEWNGYRCVSSIKAKNPVTTTMYTREGEAVSNAAFRLRGWQDSYFLDLGFGSVKWANGHLKEASPYIAAPQEEGDYYMWGKTTVYQTSDAPYTGAYVKESTDAAYAKNTAWRLPSKAEAEALIDADNMQWTWVSVNSEQEGSYLATSRKNGLSMLMRAAGYRLDPWGLMGQYHTVNFWSSSPGSAGDMGCGLVALGPGAPLSPSSFAVGDLYRRMGISIRPVTDR